MKLFLFKITQAIKSKTFWLITITFLINGIPAVRSLVPPEYLPYVDLFLALVTTATHVFPSQNYFAVQPGETTTVTDVNQ